jgi:ABC-type dipeptide/oligopeptide/nickel transport system permease component
VGLEDGAYDMTILERTPASGPAAPPPAERRAGPSRRSGAALLGRLVAPGLATAGQLAQAAFTLVGASVIIWLLSAVSPVDPAQRVLATRGIRSPSPEQLETVRRELGLESGLLERYGDWIVGVLQGNLGTSYISGRPVTVEIMERLGATFVLAGTALCLILVVASVLGMASAAIQGGSTDLAVRMLTIFCAAVPSFIVALVFIQVFVIRMGVGVALADGSLAQVLLPAACVAISAVAIPTRVLRGSLLEGLDQRYALVARGRGGGRLYILLRHALPNSIIPFLHAMALTAAWMIGGTVVVEAVFNWPGVGSYLVQSIQMGDLPVIQAIVLLATASYIAASLVADLATSMIDPRTRSRS